ncbi:HDOD domain-containing protein [Teredinibacter sp. KSP-S5-2]|nr:HDOD domain-containing protein [Teredinibacter sp. KSP-S5-2]WNO09283.1 HDOD domain-containing protein [Teredinibacter sp. KSP-S5-2]
MSLPTSVVEMLETQKVHYNITEMDLRNPKLPVTPNTGNSCVVRSILVEDAQGRAQVLIPSDTMLDLDSMYQQFARNFVAVPNSEVRPLINEHHLTAVPAIPRWQGMPTLVEASLLQRENLLLETGDQHSMLELDHNGFSSIIKTASIGSFAIKIPELSADPDKDEKQIQSSVERFTQLRIKQRLEETLELPPLPESAQRIIKLRADPNADISDLTNIVEIDPSLAAQVVSWAASPYYSAPGKIKSVHDAIVRVLGFDMVLNLALGLALGKTLSTEQLSHRQVATYWRNAVYTAAAVEGLVTSIAREHRPSFGMAYLSGLLSNIGTLILAEVFPPYLNNIMRLSDANPHVPVAAVEQHCIKVTGNQIASWLLDNWNMPQEVVIALRQQNNIDYSDHHQTYSKLIYLAKRMLANHGFGTAYGGAIPMQLFKSLHLDPETADITIENLLESGDDLDDIADKLRG